MRARRAIAVGLVAAAAARGLRRRRGRTTVADEPPAEATSAEADNNTGDGAVGDGDGGVALERIGDFDQPVYVTQPPSGDDDHLYVVEQCGTIQRVPIDGGEASSFLDVSDSVSCGGEQGLLSVAFAPDYARSGDLYVNYTDADGNSRTVAYQRADGDPPTADPESARELLRSRTSPPTTTAACCSSAPTASSTSGSATAAPPATPSATARISSRRSASSCGSIRDASRRVRARGDRPAQPVALLVRSQDRRSVDRRRRPGHLRGDRRRPRRSSSAPSSTSAGRPTRADRRFNEDQKAPGAVPPVYFSTAATAAAR